MSVVEHGDAPDQIVARVLQLLHIGAEALHGIHGRRVGGGAVLLHHRRGVGHGGAVHDVHHKGIDAAALRHPEVVVRVLDSRAVEVQRPHLVGHIVACDGALFHREIVQPRRVAAAPAIAPCGVELVQRLVVLGLCLRLRHADVGVGDVALAPVAGDLPAQHVAVRVQPVEADDRQRHALFHGTAGDGARLIQQAHAPQGVHDIHLHRLGGVVGQTRRVQQHIAVLPVDDAHAPILPGLLQICGYIGHLTAPHQYAQHLAAVGVIHRRGGGIRSHIADGGLGSGRRQLLPV